MSNLLVVGASGSLGRRLVPRLRARGHTVVGMARSSGTPLSELEHIAPEMDAVVNLAGAPVLGRWTASRWQQIVASRVDLGRRVVAAMRPGAHLLNGSAIGIYGERGDAVLDHRSAPGAGPLADLCRDWEAAVERDDVPVARLRTGIVLDPDSGALATMLPAFRLGLGGPVGGGRQWQSWIHVDDWLAAVVHVLEQRLVGPVDLVAPNPVRQAAFAAVLGGALGRPAVLPAPAWALRAALGQASEVVLSSQRVQPTALLESGFTFRHPELGHALRDLVGSPPKENA